MKKWNDAEVVELSLSSTAKCNGNTPEASDNQYKKKTNHCECGHNTNFFLDPSCPDCGYDGDYDYTNGMS